MARPGNSTSNSNFGIITEFSASIQMYIGTNGSVKAAEASVGISEVYLNELKILVLKVRSDLIASMQF